MPEEIKNNDAFYQSVINDLLKERQQKNKSLARRSADELLGRNPYLGDEYMVAQKRLQAELAEKSRQEAMERYRLQQVEQKRIQEEQRQQRLRDDNALKQSQKTWFQKAKDVNTAMFENTYNFIKDAFGGGKDYEKAYQQYGESMSTNGIIDVISTPKGFQLKNYNKGTLDSLFNSELDNILGEGNLSELNKYNIKRTYMTGYQAEGMKEGKDKERLKKEKQDTWFGRMFTTGLMNISNSDEKTERVSALIDRYLEIEQIGETLSRRAKSHPENLLYTKEDKIKGKEDTYAETIRNFMHGATELFTSPLETNYDRDLAWENNQYNVSKIAGQVFTQGKPEAGRSAYNYIASKIKGTTPEGKREDNYVSWTRTKDAIDQLHAIKIASLPPGERAVEEMERERALKSPDSEAYGYWQRWGMTAADLIGSVFTPTGEFSASVKGVNAIANKTGALLSTSNKWQRAVKIMTTNSDKVEDLAKVIQKNPSLMNRGKLLLKGLGSKNLAVDDVTLHSMKGFFGSATSNVARMTIASSLVNAMDKDMSNEEAWDATVNLGMLFAGNELFTRSIGRVARGMKLFNAGSLKFQNPLAFGKQLEKMYYASAIGGQALSQAAINAKNDINILDKNGDFNDQWLGEMGMNFFFAGKEFSEGYKSGARARQLEREKAVSPSKISKVDITNKIDPVLPEDAVVNVGLVPDQTGHIKLKVESTQRTDTAGNLVKKGADENGLDANNLNTSDILTIFKEQHGNLPKEKQLFVEKLAQKLKDTPVAIEDIGDNVYAGYDTKSNRIIFNDNAKAIDADYETTYSGLIEEMTHAFTTNAYHTRKDIKSSIDKSYEAVKTALETPEGREAVENKTPEFKERLEYYTSNPHEFLAIYTNPQLKDIAQFVQRVSNKDIETPFFSSVKRLFSKDKNEQEVFKQVFESVINPKESTIPTEPITPVGEVNTSQENVLPKQEPINIVEEKYFPQGTPQKENTNVSEQRLAEDIPMDYPIEEFGEPVKQIDGDLINNDDIFYQFRENVKAIPNEKVFDADRLNDLISEYNKVNLERFPEHKPISIIDVLAETNQRMGSDANLADINDYMERKLQQMKIPDVTPSELTDAVIAVEKTEPIVSDPIKTGIDKFNAKSLLGAKSMESVVRAMANKSSNYIKDYLLNSIPSDYKGNTAEEIDIATDIMSSRLQQTKSYPTLTLKNGLLVENPRNNYYDRRPTGYDGFADKFFLNDNSYSKDSKQLLSSVLKGDLYAIHNAKVTGSNGEMYDSPVSNHLEKVYGEGQEKMITDNLLRGYYMIPRGATAFTVIKSPLLRALANSPLKAYQVAQKLHKDNFFKWLSSDNTWGYSPEKPDFSEYSKMLKFSKLYDSAMGKKVGLSEIATHPDFISTLQDAADLMQLLKKKMVEYYTDSDGNTIPIDHLTQSYDDVSAKDNQEQILLALDNEITSSLLFAVDPAGESRTVNIKNNGEVRSIKQKKTPLKYMSVLFGRSAGQLNDLSSLNKHLRDVNNDKVSIQKSYESMGMDVNFDKGTLDINTLVIDPTIFKNTNLQGITDASVDGASFFANAKLPEFITSTMGGSSTSNVLKPRWYSYDDNGNAFLYKTAAFSLINDKHTSDYHKDFVDLFGKYANQVGIVTFNSALKSGSTYKMQPTPSALKEGSILYLNKLGQPVSASTDGKYDAELFANEQEYYAKSLLDGTLDKKHYVKLSMTGDNPVQWVGEGHGVTSDNAGALGINRNPLYNPNFEFWKGADGEQAFKSAQNIIHKVVDNNVTQIRDLLSLRDVIYGLGSIAKDMPSDEARAMINDIIKDKQTTPKYLGSAVKSLMNVIKDLPDAVQSWDFISNMGVEQTHKWLSGMLTDKGELKIENLYLLGTLNKLISGEQGGLPGENSVLNNAIRKYYDNASKVRVPGANLLLIPDMQASGDMGRLLEYKLSKLTNSVDRDNLAIQAQNLMQEHINNETFLYKKYSNGVSLGKDVIDKYGLSIGDKMFVKLTPADDLHSIVPVLLTGMTSDGGITMNTDYLTNVMGRDFDKDALQVFLSNDEINKTDFNNLYDHYMKKGMHKGYYKDNTTSLAPAYSELKGNRRKINDTYSYEKKPFLPQEANASIQGRRASLGQGAGIATRNVLSSVLLDARNAQKKISTTFNRGEENFDLDATLSYPEMDGQEFASRINDLVQKSVDSYDYQPFDKVVEMLKLFIKDPLSIKSKTGNLPTETEVNFSDSPEQKMLADAILRSLQKELSLNNKFSGLKSLLPRKESYKGTFAESVESIMARSLADNKISDITKIEDLTLGYQSKWQDAFVKKHNKTYASHPLAETATQVSNVLKDAMSSFYRIIRNSRDATIYPVIYNNNKFTAFGNNETSWLREAKGVLFNAYYNNTESVPTPEPRLLDIRNGEKLYYHSDGIKAQLLWNDKTYDLDNIFADDGKLNYPDLLHFPETLDKKLVSANVLVPAGFNDAEKSRIMGSIVGSVAKSIASSKDANIDAGELASMIGLSNSEGWNLFLPSQGNKNGFVQNRLADISNVEAGVRRVGITPTMQDGSTIQEHYFSSMKDIGVAKVGETTEGNINSLPVLPKPPEPEILGMPIFKDSKKASDLSSSVMNRIRKSIPAAKTIDNVTPKEWDNLLASEIYPEISNILNVKDENTPDYIKRIVDDSLTKLTANAIDNTLHYREDAIRKQSLVNQVPKAMSFVNKTIRSQFLLDYLTEINRISKGIKDNKFLEYRLTHSNSKDILVNDNATNAKLYSYNDPIYPVFKYINGERATEIDPVTQEQSLSSDYFKVGDIFDRRYARNKFVSVLSKDWVDKVLPIKRQTYINDNIKSLSKTWSEHNKQREGAFNALRVFEGEDLKNVGELIDDALSVAKYHWKYDTDLSDFVIRIGNDVTSKAIVPETMSKNVSDLLISHLSNKGISSDVIVENANEIHLAINSLLSFTRGAKEYSSLLQANIDNMTHVLGKTTHPASKDLLSKSIADLRALSDEIKDPTFATAQKYLGRFDISDETAMQILETNLLEPRRIALEERSELLRNLNFKEKNETGSLGILKSVIEREYKSVSNKDAMKDPDYITDLLSMPVQGSTLEHILRFDGNDPSIAYSNMRRLVEINNTEMGKYFNALKMIIPPNEYASYDLPLNKTWEELSNTERSTIHNQVSNLIDFPVKQYKSQQMQNRQVSVYFSDLPEYPTAAKQFNVEDILSVLKPEMRKSYSMDNMYNAIERSITSANMNLQKAINIDYNLAPDNNAIVNQILLGEFASATGSQYHYSTQFDASKVKEIARDITAGKELPFNYGNPISIVYADAKGSRNIIGKYAGSIMSKVVDKKNNVIDTEPYMVILDNGDLNKRTTLVPYTRINNVMTGSHANAFHRKHDELLAPAYESFANNNKSAFEGLASRRIVEKPIALEITSKDLPTQVEKFPVPLLSGDVRTETKNQVIDDMTDMIADKNQNTLPKSFYNLGKHLVDMQVVSTYGYLGNMASVGVGLGTIAISPLTGIAMTLGALGKMGLKFAKATAGNYYGVGAGVRIHPYLTEQNTFARGLAMLGKSIKYAIKSNKQEASTDAGQSIASIKLTALEASNDAKNTFDYLIGEDKAKIVARNPLKQYAEAQRLASDKAAILAIDDILTKKHADRESTTILDSKIQEYIEQNYNKLKGKKINVIGGNVYVNGKSLNDVKGLNYGLLDILKSYSMLNGVMANQEKTSYVNALYTGIYKAEDIVKSLRTTEESNSVPLPVNLLSDFLFKHIDTSIGNYDKTPGQKDPLGKALQMYSHFGKESFLGDTRYAYDRQVSANIMKEVYGQDKDFVKWYENKNGVPFADFDIRNEKSEFASKMIVNSLLLGTATWLLGTGLNSLINYLNEDETNEENKIKNVSNRSVDEFVSVATKAFNIDRMYIDFTSTLLSAYVDATLPPKTNEKKFSKSTRSASSLLTRPAGFGYNIGIDELTKLSLYGIRQMYDDEKMDKAIGQTIDDNLISTQAKAASLVLPGSRSIVSSLLTDKRREVAKEIKGQRELQIDDLKRSYELEMDKEQAQKYRAEIYRLSQEEGVALDIRDLKKSLKPIRDVDERRKIISDISRLDKEQGLIMKTREFRKELYRTPLEESKPIIDEMNKLDKKTSIEIQESYYTRLIKRTSDEDERKQLKKKIHDLYINK